MSITEFFNFFTAQHAMQVLLALLILIVLTTLVKLTANRNEKFDLRDLVATDGHLDEKKFTRFGAWVISTWAFVYILVSSPNAFPEWYFVGYMGVWVTNAIFDKYMQAKLGVSMPPATGAPPAFGTQVPQAPDRPL